MSKRFRFFIWHLTSASLLIAGVSTHSVAQEKISDAALKLEMRVLVDNDRVQVIEERLSPGAQSESETRPYRVVRVLKGGQLQRIYPDGRIDAIEWKADEVRVAPASSPYILKNVGTTEVILYAVRLK